MSQIIDIADAVVSLLNGHEFAVEFTAERLYQPIFDLQDMQTLHVTVAPRTETIAVASRSQDQFDYTVDVGVQQKLSTTRADDVDTLMDLVEEIADYVRHRNLALPVAHWLSIERDPVFVAEHLDQLRQFTAVISLTYRMRR